MNYSPLTERHFRKPANTGPLAGPRGAVVRGEAGTCAQGLRIVFEARVEAGRIAAIAFRALACPHLIAACSRTTELLTGMPLAAARQFDAMSLMEELGIPAEKRGRVLVLEDALHRCLAAWDTTQSPSADRPQRQLP
jgi:NifU-like protein involved in Fe-S cluster formation